MERLNLIQGSPEWLAHRATARNGSEAAAMMGVSPYMTRSELLAALKTGVRREPTPEEQRRFDKGHAVERALRPKAEAIIGETLYPVVGTDGYLSSSFDGLTMADDVDWEAKSINDELRAVFAGLPQGQAHEGLGEKLPIYHQIQMEQGLALSGAEKTLFSCGDIDANGNLIEEYHCWYYPNKDLRARILAAWLQGDADLATVTPPEAVQKVVAEPVQALPAVVVQVSGSIALKDNFKVFETAFRDFLENRFIREPKTDQDFADLDLQIKAMKGAEATLESAEGQMLAQVASIDTAKKTKDMLHKLVRDNRLMAEKLLASEKERRKGEIVAGGVAALRDYVNKLNERIGQPYMPAVPADFAGAIRGKSSITKMEDAVATTLANAKIAANDIADKITLNLRTLKAHAEYEFLFADVRQIVLKAPEDFQALVRSRVLAHRAEEKRRAEAAAERERERIRQEETDKLRREQQEREAGERRQREESEALARRQSEATQAPAGVPMVAPAVSSKPPAANSPSVVPIARGKPTLRLGQINERIAPLQVTAAGLESLGFKAAGKEGASVLFHEADFGPMVDSLVAHLRMAQQRQSEPVAA